jgi:hypothetical protein
MCASLGLEKGNDVLCAATFLIRKRFLGAFGEEFNRRVSSNVLFLGSRFRILRITIYLGNDDVRVSDEVLREALPDRRQLFAV